MKRLVFGFLTALVPILVTVLAFEGLTRWVVDDGMQYDLEMWKYARDVKKVSSDPLIGHEHAAKREARLMGADFQTNSNGLRDREFPFERVPGKFRVVMLGDSLTVGWGVALEDTFSKRIERLYAKNGVDAEVINTGVGNWNTIQEVEYFLTKGYRYQPDMVVLNFFVNDAEPVSQDRPPSALMRNCYACVFVVGRLDTVTRRFFGKSDWSDYYLSLYGDGTTKGWVDAKEAIHKLADFCKERKITLLIASLPELHDVGNYRLQRITDMVHQAADQYGVAFVDILPYLKDTQSSRLWVTPPDPHPNALAHQLIAQGLFDAMQKVRSP